MTDISFHTHLPDRLGYACRLLRKALRQQAQVVVTGPSRDLVALDRLLWVFDPMEFLPHVRAEAGQPVPARLRATPVWLTEAPLEAPHREVLVQLGDEVLACVQEFKRVIELVPDDEAGLRAGRARWRHYAEQGHTLQKHQSAGERSA